MFNALKEKNCKPVTLYNTGGLYDLMTGSYSLGPNGKYYLKGGIPEAITGTIGKGNTYKSTFDDSLLMGALRIYDNADLFIWETEGSKLLERVMLFCDDQLHTFNDKPANDVLNRITIVPEEYKKIGAAFKFLQMIIDEKIKNKKQCMITTPFIDPKTGEYVETWTPTFVFIDSLSIMEAEVESEMMKKGLDHKSNNTVGMVDANKKTVLVRKLRDISSQYGICVVCTAHIGKDIQMDSFAPPSKVLQFMKQGEKITGVGSKFDYLTHVLAQTGLPQLSLDSSKQGTFFPYGKTNVKDINNVPLTIHRNKTSSSGQLCKIAISQAYGMLTDVTYYQYIRDLSYLGMTAGASSSKNSCVLLPDVKFSRNEYRTVCKENYKVARAMELMARYLFIQDNWNLETLPVDFSRTPEELYATILEKGLNMDELLETTSYWSYNDLGREYMSIFDLLVMVA